MDRVKPKKSLGQHFLRDKSVAEKIAGSLSGDGCSSVLEVGPGMGILTGFLLKRQFPDFRVIEIDRESVSYLREAFRGEINIIEGDFLAFDIRSSFTGRVAIIGNFPYNISSQIFFRVLENRDMITEVCGMLQKEVAQRICAKPGSKTYGILSVLLQAYYSAGYLFSVPPGVFSPPPKVMSGVVRLTRNTREHLDCDEDLFLRVVKGCFNQRRKTLRNSVRAAFNIRSEDNNMLQLRPEQLSVDQFVDLTNWISENLITSE
jgi:16S rRNA (adenine1518-N6/adenine1519-N6)-dimethyltransferase